MLFVKIEKKKLFISCMQLFVSISSKKKEEMEPI